MNHPNRKQQINMSEASLDFQTCQNKMEKYIYIYIAQWMDTYSSGIFVYIFKTRHCGRNFV